MASLRRRLILAFVAACATLVALPAPAQDKSIVVASTTSTEQSGLFGYLLPAFTKKTGIAVKVVAVGTGQALDIGRRGDADVVFVHDRPAEDKFMAEKEGVKRYPVMYNDFVLVGPRADPAKITSSGLRALTALADCSPSTQSTASAICFGCITCLSAPVFPLKHLANRSHKFGVVITPTLNSPIGLTRYLCYSSERGNSDGD